jgi:hypothetical protein
MYLETGLHGSFADYPNVKRPFGVPQATPLDLDLVEAVEFLESQVENGNHRHSHAGVNTDQRG